MGKNVLSSKVDWAPTPMVPLDPTGGRSPQTLVIGLRSALAMCVHPKFFWPGDAPESYLAPFLRYGDLLAENCEFLPTPPSFNALARVNPFNFWMNFLSRKLESLSYPSMKISWSYLASFSLSASVWQTDGQTDGQPDCSYKQGSVDAL